MRGNDFFYGLQIAFVSIQQRVIVRRKGIISGYGREASGNVCFLCHRL